MFCHKCGNKNAEGAAFCQQCGTMMAAPALPLPAQNMNLYSPVMVSTEQQSVTGLCTPMCILRFLDAAIWTFIVISQISAGFGFGLIIWNVIATGISYVYAVRLLGACKSNMFDGAYISGLARENKDFSIICAIWYGIQFFFLNAGSILLFSLMIEIAILIIAAIAISKLSRMIQQ